jgi:hypothetical protein
MRQAVVAAALIVLTAATARADSIRYTFAGTMSYGSYLDNGDGILIDLSGATFSATGITGERFADSTWDMWLATTTYDFGALGSFTTNTGADKYVQNGILGSIGSVGLLSWQPGVMDTFGFWAAIPTQVASGTDPIAFGTVAATAADVGARSQGNTAGQSFYLAHHYLWDGAYPNLVIQSVTTEAVPEPATAALLLLGVLCVHRRRRVPR